MPETPSMTFTGVLELPKLTNGGIAVVITAKMPTPPPPPEQPVILRLVAGEDMPRSQYGTDSYRLQNAHGTALAFVPDGVPAGLAEFAALDDESLERDEDDTDEGFKAHIDGLNRRHRAALDAWAKLQRAVAPAQKAYEKALAKHQADVEAMRDEYLQWGSLASMGSLLKGQEFEVTLKPSATPSDGSLPGMTAALMLAGPSAATAKTPARKA